MGIINSNTLKLVGLLGLAMAMAVVVSFSGCGGDLHHAQESYRVGDYPRALRLYEAELDHHPSSFEARYGYALVLQEISLKKKEQGEDNLEAWLTVVREYEICSRLGDADAFSENYANTLFHLANRLYLQEKYVLAQEYLEKARALDPKNKYVLNLAGIVEYSLGKYKEAQETFEFLLALDPSFVSGYLNLGNVLWESGQEDAALVTWKQALNLSPGNVAVIQRIEAALQKISGS
jgi:tetratricopeptide (TPR) repeat protein